MTTIRYSFPENLTALPAVQTGGSAHLLDPCIRITCVLILIAHHSTAARAMAFTGFPLNQFLRKNFDSEKHMAAVVAILEESPAYRSDEQKVRGCLLFFSHCFSVLMMPQSRDF